MAWLGIRTNPDGSVVEMDTVTGQMRTRRTTPQTTGGFSTNTGYYTRGADNTIYKADSRGSVATTPQIEQQRQSQDPNSVSTLAHVRSQGANVGDVRDFGGQQWRWNGNSWERQGGSGYSQPRRSFNEVVPQRSSSVSFSSLLDRVTPVKTNSPSPISLANPLSVDQVGKSPASLNKTLGQFGYSVANTPFASQLQSLQTIGNNSQIGGLKQQFPGLGSAYDTPPFGSVLGTSTPRRSNVTGEDSQSQNLGGSGLFTPNPNYKKNLDTQKKGLEQDIATFNENLSTTNDDLGLGSFGTDEFFALDAGANESLNNLRARYEQGYLDESQAIREAEEIERNRLIGYYNTLNEMAMSEIPEIQQNAEKGIARVQENLSRLKRDATQVKDDVTEQFGGQVRRIWENAQAGQNRLKNVYSALGSVESSDFLDRLAAIEKASGTSAADTERELGKRVTSVDQQLLDATKDAGTLEQDIIDKRDALIREVKNRVDLNNLQKIEEITQIVLQAADSIQKAKQNFNANMGNVDMFEQESLINRGNILAQGAVDTALLDKQYQMEKDIYNQMTPGLPPELDNELKRFMIAPSSGYNSQLKRQQLKSRFPEWADIIDGVYGGMITDLSALTTPQPMMS